MRNDGRDVAKHVVKFGDGSYLGYSLTYESRVLLQRDAHRWLTWASAKVIADGTPFVGKGARAVHLVTREEGPVCPRCRNTRHVCSACGKPWADCPHDSSHREACPERPPVCTDVVRRRSGKKEGTKVEEKKKWLKHGDIATLAKAIITVQMAGLRVHHVEVGVTLWQMWAAAMSELPLRDDVGFGSRPGGPKAPLLEGVVLVPGALVAMDQWALVFGSLGDAATDYALTPEHRKLYEDAIARGELT